MKAAVIRCILVVLVAGVAPGAAWAQNQPRGCLGDEHRQFDFWVGEWDVFNPNGQQVGTNRITRTLGDCVLEENWEGRSGSIGTSYNMYDSRTGRWHQTWVDNGGLLLLLDGGLEDGKMVLTDDQTGPDGTGVVHRITWQPLADGNVRQHWEQSSDGGESWRTVFEGTYVKRGGE